MYRLKRTNGDFYAGIAPNIILGPQMPTSSPINLIGRNKVSYGEAQNENFLWLTENFASRGVVPSASITGQIWYNYSNLANGVGELMLSPTDNANISDWVTIPLIMNTNTEPAESTDGRIIIYKKNRLKIRMENTWHTIVTEIPKDQMFSSLLEIKNNANMINRKYTTVTWYSPLVDNFAIKDDHVISRFNEGGYLISDNGNMTIGGNDFGILKYGSVYQWEADIIGRLASNSAVYKVWKLKGVFHIAKESEQSNPDPRKITPFNRNTITYEIISEQPGTESWDVTANADYTSDDIPNVNLTISDILDGEFYGLKFVANVNQSNKVLPYATQWSILMRMTGIPASPDFY